MPVRLSIVHRVCCLLYSIVRCRFLCAQFIAIGGLLLIAYCVVVLSVYRSSLVRFIADCVCCLFVGGLLALSCGRLKAQVGRLPCPSSYLSSLPLKKNFNQSGH